MILPLGAVFPQSRCYQIMGTVNRPTSDLNWVHPRIFPSIRIALRFLPCLVLLSSPLLPLTAQASEPPLRIILNDVAPYAIVAGSGFSGLHHQILAALLTETGLQASIMIGPYGRLKETLEQKQADLAVGLDSTQWTGPVIAVGEFHRVQYQLLPHRASGIHTMETLAGKTIGIARGAYYDPRIHDDPTVRTFIMTDPFQGVRMLARGRLDAVASSNYLLAYALRQKGLKAQSFAPAITFSSGAYTLYAAETVSADTRDALREGLDRLHRKGVIGTLTGQYR